MYPTGLKSQHFFSVLSEGNMPAPPLFETRFCPLYSQQFSGTPGQSDVDLFDSDHSVRNKSVEYVTQE